MTAPHIGNTGMNDEDPESRRIWVDGFVVRDPARRPSNFRSTRSLDDDLVSDGIVSISGVDTRAITLILREAGVMRGGIFSGDQVSTLMQSRPMLQTKCAHVVGYERSRTFPIT
jgi:carbamoyl-phosphate synthase small subunit